MICATLSVQATVNESDIFLICIYELYLDWLCIASVYLCFQVE